MHFAKLFTFDTGQLLVTIENSDETEHDEAPYRILTETRYRGVSMRLGMGWRSQKARDLKFAGFDEAKGLEFFTKQRKTLRDAVA